jgi:glycosyltransferase involved in cell wall biosynthesis
MLEACASGKPIVASRTAIEGLSLIDGEHVILAETDREFADAAVAMMRDSERRARLAEASRIWAQQANDDGQWSAQYAQLHANIIDGRGSRSR